MNPPILNKPVKPTGTFAKLTDAQKEQLYEWLNSTQTYNETIQCLETEFGIPGVTMGVLKNFRQKYYAQQLEANPHCPRPVPIKIWGFNLGKMVEALKDPETKIEVRVRVSAFLLQLSRVTLEYEKLSAKPRARKGGKAGAGTDSQTVPEENPFDDQDKLDEVRREVFGSAPNSKKSTPAT
jgi:hypothetical protein